MSVIHVDNLVKYYRVHHKEPGLRASIRSLFHRQYETVKAVDGISFDMEQGEIVGFLGPNGAGKTTTLKCLSGLLYPTSGSATVLGYTPHQRKNEYLKQFTLVMGQRNELMWDLPAMETFLVNQAIYGVPEAEFRESLDEPTLGLDVTAQAALRDFVLAYNQRHSATVLLTSHYMADVMALARRILVIEQGNLVYDGDLHALVEQTAPYKLLKLTLQRPVDTAALQSLGEVESVDGLNVTLRVPRAGAKDAAGGALGRLDWWLALIAVGLAVALFIVASLFWRFALTRYTSASS